MELEARSVTNEPVDYYHAHWTRRHSPLLDELGAVIDHMVALAVGGEDDLENMCTACNKCNIRKNSAHLDIWDQRPKRSPIKSSYGDPVHWDGLSITFIALAKKDLKRLNAGERA